MDMIEKFQEQALKDTIEAEAALNQYLQLLKISREQWAELKRLQAAVEAAVDGYNYWEEHKNLQEAA